MITLANLGNLGGIARVNYYDVKIGKWTPHYISRLFPFCPI
jgi:hypothetical protein